MEFCGSFDHLLDEKGRVSIPIRFREALQRDGDDKLYITNMFNGKDRCLDVYPPREWSNVVAKFKQVGGFNTRLEKFETFYVGNAHELQVDRQGRILIPPKLRAFAGLAREVTFHALTNRFQLWDTATLTRALAGIVEEMVNEPDFMEKLNIQLRD